MGEMIKFGIKLAMTIATAVALVAAIALLYSVLAPILTGANSTSGSGMLMDLAKLISLVFPLNLGLFASIITPLISFKIAYWAADKMIQFIEAAG